MPEKDYKQLKNEMKDFIFQANQSGKSETSNLVRDILTRMDENTVTVVKEQFEELGMKEFMQTVQDHITHDREWKEKFSPYMEGLASVTVGGKIVAQLIVGLASVGAAIFVIYDWFRK